MKLKYQQIILPIVFLVITSVWQFSSPSRAQTLVRCPAGPNDLIIHEFYGESELDNFGLGLDSAGDFNKDGFADMVIGSPFNDLGGQDGGAAYLFLGGAAADSDFDFRLLAEADEDQLGYSVAGAGDFDNDGYDDIAIGAPWNDRAGTDKGAVWLVFGSDPPFGSRQLVLTGVTSGPAGFGYALAGGDFNGDGISDLAVGAPFDSPSQLNSQAGKVQVFFGDSSMDPNADVTLLGEAANNQFGWSVASAGDLNRDGYEDLVVGARWYGTLPNTARGKIYVYLGGDPMDTTADVEFTGENGNDWLGYSVAGAGDVNQDGFADLLAAAPFYPNGGGYGRVYLFLGAQAMDNLPDLTFTGGKGDQFGWDVDGGQDFNGDSYADIVIGARFNDCASQDGGGTSIYFGGDPMDNQADLAVGSSISDDALGTSVAMIGDWSACGSPFVATAAVWNDAGMVIIDPMTEGAFGAVFSFTQPDMLSPVANFSGTPTTGEVPLTVNFTDASTGEITSWEWSFGDGGSSTEQDPNYTYVSAGTYTVSLTVTGPSGSDTETKIDYIVAVHPILLGDFNHDDCVDDIDLSILMHYWLHNDCDEPNWCGGTDLDQSTEVNLYDFSLFAAHWLFGCN